MRGLHPACMFSPTTSKTFGRTCLASRTSPYGVTHALARSRGCCPRGPHLVLRDICCSLTGQQLRGGPTCINCWTLHWCYTLMLAPWRSVDVSNQPLFQYHGHSLWHGWTCPPAERTPHPWLRRLWAAGHMGVDLAGCEPAVPGRCDCCTSPVTLPSCVRMEVPHLCHTRPVLRR